MSKIINGRMQTYPSRESHAEQMFDVQNKKKRSTHLRSLDDTDVAYRDAPEYLRQLMNTSTLSSGHSARGATRTYSTGDVISSNNRKKTHLLL